MAAHKHIDRICAAVLALTLAVSLLFVNGQALGLQASDAAAGYEARLFDTGRVHTIDIVMDGWEDFLAACENEAYAACALVIDGEAYKNTAIRAKGNTSLTSVAAYGNNRYSFKVEFDHYDSASTYYGLDKLNLNNLIQDNTCMKDFLVYQLMAAFGAAAPLCSYVFLTVNGEPWGLYLAVEGVEDAFLRRNYGNDAGELYKPDSMSLGGGRGNGGGFDFDELDFSQPPDGAPADNGGMASPPDGGAQPQTPPDGDQGAPQVPGGFGGAGEGLERGGMSGDSDRDPSGGFAPGGRGGNMGGGMGSSDVKLQYIDDDPDSYANIFDNAKTEITEADKARLIASLKLLSQGETGVVDVDQVIRYFVVHGFVCNGDSYTGSMIHNYYLYEKDGVLSMLPWDYNLAFGGFQSASATSTVNEPIDTPVTGSVDDRPMLAWIFSNEAYTGLYHQYYSQFAAQCLESGWCAQLIRDTAALIAPYVEEDPTKFCTYEEFQTGVTALETFCQLRAQSVRGQLDGTIPSTTQGQAADASALVDASGLNLSDMGSMNQGGGPGGGEQGGSAQVPEGFEGERQQAFAPGSGSQLPERTGQGGGPANGFRTEGALPASPSPAGSGVRDGVLLAVSAAVLLAGLLFAAKFRRRG